MAVVKCAKYISTEVDANKNRFWYGYLNDDSTVKVEWGRVGNSSQSKVHDFPSQDAAQRFFEGKCREKEGPKKGYRKLNVIDNVAVTSSPSAPASDVKQAAAEQIEAGCPVAKKLIERLVEWNVHQITSRTTIHYNQTTGLFSTPLGIVTQDAIDSARDLLVKMRPLVEGRRFRDRAYTSLLNDYLMLIPQDVGRKLDPERLYPDVDAISKQGDLLDSLEASLAASIKKPKSKKKAAAAERVFDVRLGLVEDDAEVARIKKKYRDTASSVHECRHLDVKTVYDVQIGAMKSAFDAEGSKKGNVNELWHGTSKGNLLSILSKGFVIPKNYVNGWAFGAGVYFANRSTKSLQYSYGTWTGLASRDDNCFMFLADVAMGKPYTPRSSDSSLHTRGYDSVHAKVGVTSYLQNDEIIVFNTNQCNPTRLIEFSSKS